MLPFPPPLLPEPITVPNNAADASYNSRLRFIKIVGLLNLVSLAAVVAFMFAIFHSALLDVASRFSNGALVICSVASLVALSAARRGPILFQILLWLSFIALVSVPLGFVVSQLHEAFPVFTETAGWSLATCWAGLTIYHFSCGRDFSFFGMFCLVYLTSIIVTVTLTILSKEVSFIEGITIVLLITLFLFYWVYDMAMVLRRRTIFEPIQAVLDLYRDLLNFVGFPIRVLRMGKRKGRVLP